MYNSIVQAECVNLGELEHLFIDLEYESSRTKTSGIYRSRSFNQKNKKYLQIDEIKQELSFINKSNLKYIYLLGKNSMFHHEFNHILRLCLSYCPVTIFSNGDCINDKKSRFLKRVEDEGENEIVFKIFINHYDEKKNDEVAGRGSFRKALHAINSLNKYGFNPVLVIKSDFSNNDDLKQGFVELGKKFKFETENINFSFVSTDNSIEFINNDFNSNTSSVVDYDCMHSRILSKSGVYNCPMLLNDFRGRCGSSLKDYSHKSYLETDMCQKCMMVKKKMYVNDWT